MHIVRMHFDKSKQQTARIFFRALS